MFSRTAAKGPLLLSLVLAGCGGGSGSGSPPVARIDQSHFSVTALSTDPAPTRSTIVTVENAPRDGLYAWISHTDSALQFVDLLSLSQTTGRLEIRFESPESLPSGDYHDEIEISLCIDERCRRPVSGSPVRVTTTYTVTQLSADPPLDPDPEWTELPVLSRTELPHDVLDADYSTALDAILMVSSRPSNALHVYFPQTGISREIPLPKIPTALAVAPDGMSAAVGHDALISHLDLQSLEGPGDPELTILPVSAEVGDLALDGRGYIHVIPAVSQWVNVISVELATGEERLSERSIYAGGRVAMHPSGEAIYVATRGVSPSKIARHDVSSGRAEDWRDSPYHGTYQACGDLWMSELGNVIYTACGNTFRASADPQTDMGYTGALSLSFVEDWGSIVVSLSQSAATREITLIEQPQLACLPHGNPADCRSRVSIHESDFLNRSDVFEVPRIQVGTQWFRQDALFVFHSANGAHRYMISRLFGAPAEPHYVSVLQ